MYPPGAYVPADILLHVDLPILIFMVTRIKVPFVGDAGLIEKFFEDQRVSQPAVVMANIKIESWKLFDRYGFEPFDDLFIGVR